MEASNALSHLQQAHHAQIAADYDLKRRYLSLLPPQQVIEICLTFDYYVPPYIKAPIWPQNLSGAIAALKPSESSSSKAEKVDDKSKDEPAMDSLQDPTPSESKERPIKIEEPAANLKPPDHGPSSTPTSYPHQAYGVLPFHTPYYASPWPGYQPYPPPPHLLNSAARPTGATGGGPDATDELPSYEEMLTEALTECTEPDGLMAPKDLFNWMASRYPLQSNFRPSASQALQRAFKRGRFEKTSTGKYRLNPNFDGPTTSRRSTRRPQTMNAATNAAQPIKSPFTHTPLLHLRPGALQYPYAPFARFALPQDQAKSTTKLEIGDPYEAAQQILKNLQQGRLIRSSGDGGEEEKPVIDKPADSATTMNDGLGDRAALQAQLALLAVQLTEFCHPATGTSTSDDDVVMAPP